MRVLDDGGPAYPVQDASKWQAHGMTMRDYFAAKAMAEVIAKCAAYDPISEKKTQSLVSTLAYQFADAMLEARK